MTDTTPSHPRLILGSTSRYRRELLQRLHVPFDVASPDVDETPHSAEAPRQLALRLALAKAHAVAKQHPSCVVIGSDQVADLGGTPLGKPGDHQRAVQQPYDCAGSAKSEGLGIALLESIDNDDPTALVGLPLIRTCRMLRAAGIPLL